jgi:hypothetical protein
MRKATIIAIISSLAIFGLASQSKSYAQSDHVKAMWVWDFYTSAATKQQRTELLQFAQKHRINLLFIGTRHSLKDRSGDYEELLSDAKQKGIRVFALAGKADWALEEKHSEALAHLQQVIDYNANHPDAEFNGIQFDIEPYTLSEFPDHVDRIGSEFLQLLQTSMFRIKDAGSRLELDGAIPFWYATSSINVTFGGVSKPLSQHILDIVDSVSIMAYRDQADAQIDLSLADIEYAASVGKKAYIGMETMPPRGDSIPDWITYYNKTMTYMNEQLAKIQQHYVSHSGFGGIAIHAYDSFKDMQHRQDQYDAEMKEKFQILQEAGILEGYPDGTARFDQTTTRAEIAVIAAKLGGYSGQTLYQPAQAAFLDVRSADWFYGWVESAHMMGAIMGKGESRFEPKAAVTVEEALIVLAKVAGIDKREGSFHYEASDWAQDWIRAMAQKGLVKENIKFQQPITREELVGILYEVYLLPSISIPLNFGK